MITANCSSLCTDYCNPFEAIQGPLFELYTKLDSLYYQDLMNGSGYVSGFWYTLRIRGTQRYFVVPTQSVWFSLEMSQAGSRLWTLILVTYPFLIHKMFLNVVILSIKHLRETNMRTYKIKKRKDNILVMSLWKISKSFLIKRKIITNWFSSSLGRVEINWGTLVIWAGWNCLAWVVITFLMWRTMKFC